LPIGKRGVIYVQSYATSQILSEALGCLFYRAKAEGKAEILQEWLKGAAEWIVAIGALSTSINIIGIAYVIYVDWPYGLTSFAQQSKRRG
jgi:hypothetical protein